MRQESAKTRTQSRERRAEEQRARTGATLRHRRRTFTCKSRRTANGGAPHVCDVIREERRRGPRGDPHRGPREGRSRAARRRMATPLRKRQKQASGSARQVLTLRANREARGERARTWKIILRLPSPPNAEPVARIAPRPSFRETRRARIPSPGGVEGALELCEMTFSLISARTERGTCRRNPLRGQSRRGGDAYRGRILTHRRARLKRASTNARFRFDRRSGLRSLGRPAARRMASARRKRPNRGGPF